MITNYSNIKTAYSNMWFVYLIQCGDLPYYKIGISESPHERLIGLQVANPLTLSLLVTCGFATQALAYQAEHNAHRELWDCNIHGEWFELTSKQIEILKCDMIKADM